MISIVVLLTIQSAEVYTSSSNDNEYDDTPYCDQTGSDYQGTCFDSQDYDDLTGLVPCKDSSQFQNYEDCPDRENNNSDDNDCYGPGFSDGQGRPFEPNKYDECGGTYYDGFISGCMSVRGNDHEICETATD